MTSLVAYTPIDLALPIHDQDDWLQRLQISTVIVEENLIQVVSIKDQLASQKYMMTTFNLSRICLVIAYNSTSRTCNVLIILSMPFYSPLDD